MKTKLNPAYPEKKSQQKGFALISVLLVLVVLTITITAFLANMRIERIAARNILNLAQAQTAADAAFTDFSQKLRYYFEQYPDSATTWETIQNHEFTAFYYRDGRPEDGGAPDFILPLVSGAQVKAYAEKADTLSAFTPTNSIDLNADNWIGTLPGETQKEFRAPWIEQQDANGKVISRYAFWAEDESFKVNVNVATNGGRGSTSLGRSPSEIPMQEIFAQIGDPDGLAGSIVDGRKKIPGSKFFTLAQINQVASQGQEEIKLSDSVKFLATAFSSALNMSRHGSKRLNLNEVVKDSTDGGEIRRQLDQIIGAINYHLPDFGQRFYRTGNDLNGKDVESSYENFYLQKIAANIRDYIDTDSQPTVIGNPNFSFNKTFGNSDIWIGKAPDRVIAPEIIGSTGPNPVMAFGKENVPMLTEVVMHVTQRLPVSVGGAGPPAPTPYDIDIDYYFEFLNMSKKDIAGSDLGDAYIQVANQMRWETGNAPGVEIPEGRDYKIYLKDIPNLIFKAGSATVITTDPSPSISNRTAGDMGAPHPSVDDSKLFKASIPDSSRSFQGQANLMFGGRATLRSVTRDNPSGQSFNNGIDFRTEFFLANNLGYLDGALYALPIGPNLLVDSGQLRGPKINPSIYHWRGGMLVGNQELPAKGNPNPLLKFIGGGNFQLGDPRANNEQLVFQQPNLTSVSDQTRFEYTASDKNDYLPVPRSSLTEPNSAASPGAGISRITTMTANWPEPSEIGGSDILSQAVIADNPLVSIGELGNIYDPVRSINALSKTDAEKARGGGLTLKIGQKDFLWDGTSSSASRNWAAWRLVDIFSTTNALEQEGLVNINGMLRDQGSALKSALYNYSFLSAVDTDPDLAGKTLPVTAVDNLIQEMQNRLLNAGERPFLERGQLSEFDLFSEGSELAGVNMQTANDRGREELFKRLVELVTTKGNTFSIYIIGQSIRETSSGDKQVLGTLKRKILFRLEPRFNNPISDSFNGENNSDLQNRFRKADYYEIKIISITS